MAFIFPEEADVLGVRPDIIFFNEKNIFSLLFINAIFKFLTETNNQHIVNKVTNPATAAAVADPPKNLEAHEAGLL